MKSRKSTKRALLLSVCSIMLCFVMLIGTTFAWFTDTASTAVNTITSGTLGIEIQDANDQPIEMLNWAAKDNRAQEQILWEPGCTYTLTPFKLVNTGSLALKYKLVVTGLDGDSELLDVIHFTYTLGGEALDLTKEGHLAAKAETKMITISATMDPSAGNEYQGKTLEGVKFNVYATQDTVEFDSMTDKYDENATYPVTSAGELKNALTEGGIVTIAKDAPVAIAPVVADKTESTLVPQNTITKDTTITLEGKLGVDAKEDYGEASPVLMAVESGTLTINGDGELNCEAGNQQVYGINVIGGKVVINGGHYYGAITAVQVQKGSLEINGGFFDMAPTCKAQVPHYAKYVVNCIDASYKNGTATISIKGGTFVNFDPSADPEGAGTSYVADGYKVVSETQTNGDIWYTVVAE